MLSAVKWVCAGGTLVLHFQEAFLVLTCQRKEISKLCFLFNRIYGIVLFQSSVDTRPVRIPCLEVETTLKMVFQMAL